jgi:hypothetical protein
MRRLFFLTVVWFGFMAVAYSQIHPPISPSINPQREIRLNNSHNRVNEPIVYVVDYLMIDRATFFPIELQKVDIKRIRLGKREPVIYITTNLAVVLNDELLLTPKEKKKLAEVQLADIELIQKIKKEQAIGLYGKKGKRGVLLVHTRSE